MSLQDKSTQFPPGKSAVIPSAILTVHPPVTYYRIRAGHSIACQNVFGPIKVNQRIGARRANRR